MRSRQIIIASILLVLASVVQWYLATSDAKAHVEMSLKHWQQQFKQTNRHFQIRWDGIEIRGAPFTHEVVLINPTFSMISGNVSYALGARELSLIESSAGNYALSFPDKAGRAAYAESGSMPEEYQFAWDNALTVQLFARDANHKISQQEPVSHIIALLPESLILTATLADKRQKISFNYREWQRVAIAQERPIPSDISGSLQIFVGMLREALVFQKQSQ